MQRRTSAGLVGVAAALGVVALLGACESRLREAPDFGEAVRQNQAAAIANPDARYVGTPAPGSNGMRVDGAQERYVRGKVYSPPATSTSEVGGGGGGGGGGGSGGGGSGGGSQ